MVSGRRRVMGAVRSERKRKGEAPYSGLRNLAIVRLVARQGLGQWLQEAMAPEQRHNLGGIVKCKPSPLPPRRPHHRQRLTL